MMLRIADRGLEAVSWVAAALVLILLFAGPSLIGAKKSGTVGYGGGNPTNTVSGSGAVAAGAAVFASAGCGNCHTLKAAGASGTIGPDLDQLRPSAALVNLSVQSGVGSMPSFAGKLTQSQIAAVANYVSSVAGR
jgi:mono/diheme cytochrome c family protein